MKEQNSNDDVTNWLDKLGINMGSETTPLDPISPIDASGLVWSNGDVNVFRVPRSHQIDGSKIKTIEDIAIIIDAMQIIVSDNYEKFDEIKHLLKE